MLCYVTKITLLHLCKPKNSLSQSNVPHKLFKRANNVKLTKLLRVVSLLNVLRIPRVTKKKYLF